uniref:Uncharacterized protein n=1 Tax=Oryza barthii TaxID=65489 RepID=A0A0D3HU24_9ORYZ
MAEPLPPPVGALGARTGRCRRRCLATSRCRPPFCAAAVVLPSTRRIRHQRQLQHHAADVSRRIEPPNQRIELAPCSTSPHRRRQVLLIFLLRNRLTPPPLAAYKRMTSSLSLFLSHVRPLVPPADLPHRSFASQTLALPTPPRRGDSTFPFPHSLHLEINRHHHVLLSAGLRSCYRRSGHLPLSLRLPPPSPGARCSGTPSPTGVPTSRPPESRHLAHPPLYFLSAARQKKRRDRTASSIGIQGADVDPDGYAEAAGNLKAQGKTQLKFLPHEIINPHIYFMHKLII